MLGGILLSLTEWFPTVWLAALRPCVQEVENIDWIIDMNSFSLQSVEHSNWNEVGLITSIISFMREIDNFCWTFLLRETFFTSFTDATIILCILAITPAPSWIVAHDKRFLSVCHMQLGVYALCIVHEGGGIADK